MEVYARAMGVNSEEKRDGYIFNKSVNYLRFYSVMQTCAQSILTNTLTIYYHSHTVTYMLLLIPIKLFMCSTVVEPIQTQQIHKQTYYIYIINGN